MALSRHLQHAKIENDTSRQSGQFGWPQRTHFTLRKGQSRRLAMGWPCYFPSHHCYLELGFVSSEVNPAFVPHIGAPYLLLFCIEQKSHRLKFGF